MNTLLPSLIISRTSITTTQINQRKTIRHSRHTMYTFTRLQRLLPLFSSVQVAEKCVTGEDSLWHEIQDLTSKMFRWMFRAPPPARLAHHVLPGCLHDGLLDERLALTNILYTDNTHSYHYRILPRLEYSFHLHITKDSHSNFLSGFHN